MILSVRKGATAPFSCLPARMGSGKARNRVKGLVPCGFLGQRPKPSESFSESISTVFKVHLSLFFAAQFFINYLTLPFVVPYINTLNIPFLYHLNMFRQKIPFSSILESKNIRIIGISLLNGMIYLNILSINCNHFFTELRMLFCKCTYIVIISPKMHWCKECNIG